MNAPRRLLAAAVAARVAFAVVDLRRLVRDTPSLPLWDEAAHGFAGVQVADALRHLNPIELCLALNRQVVWPFVHSLLLAPVFLLLGRDFAVAELASLALYAATVVTLFLAGTLLHPTRGAWVGLGAATLALLAPSYSVFGTLAMLEMPGALLLALAFALHARAASEPLEPRAVLAAGWATTALFLCKYNYGLLWLVPLAWWEWRLLPAEFRRNVVVGIRVRAIRRWWRRPMPLVFAAGVALMVGIVATGGGEFRLFGQRVSMRSPGNLAYALWLAGLLWLLIPRRGAESRARWVWARLPERARLLAQSLVLPLAVWFTLPYPNRVKEFFGFIANRDSGHAGTLLDQVLFYPRAFAADFSPAAWVAWSVLALALVAPFRRPLRDPLRLAAVAMVLGYFATDWHRYRDSRFLFTVCPLIWLCAAAGATSLADDLVRRLPGRALRGTIWAGAAVALIVVAWTAAPREADLRARRLAFRGPVELLPAMDEVLEAVEPRATAPDFQFAENGGAAGSVTAAFASAAPAGERAWLLGYSNALSPALLAWRARIARPEIPFARLPKRAPFLDAGAEEGAIEERVRWLADRADLVITALGDSLPRSVAGEYARETWADRETLARLEGSENWMKERDARLGRWRVAVFRRLR